MATTNYDNVQSFQNKVFDFENFILEPAEVRQIDTFIAKKSKPVHVTEIAELIISDRLEKIARIFQSRLYSPTDKYSIGEKILFCFSNNKLIIGEILWIESWHEITQFGHCDKMGVSLQGFEKSKIYVSNCPTFPKRSYAGEKPTGEFILPANIVNEQKEKIIPGIVNPLSRHEEFVNVDKKWFIRRALPNIRPDELELCYRCIKENGVALSSELLIREVLKIAPESEKFEPFVFSLNYCLQNNNSFVKCKIAEEIEWDIRRPVPPKTIQNTLTQEALDIGFIKITKGLSDLLGYCDLSKEITFKVYGEYEIHAYIDNGADQIYGDEIKVWFQENQLKPGDMIYINSPDTPVEKPTLYTTFQGMRLVQPTHKEEKDHIRNSNLRHRIHNLLRMRYQYLHVKEIQHHLSESLSEQAELSTIQAILSQNNHLFVRATNSRGIWGLKVWVEKHPDIDPISLGLAIREDDWVYRILEKKGDFLTIEEIAKELAVLFATHKDKIVEITFFDANDKRLIELNGKWGLKAWIENWRKRFLEIDKEILDYQNLVCSRSELEQGQKVKQAELLALEEKRATLQSSVSDIINKIQDVEHKIVNCQKRRTELQDKNTLVQQQLSVPKHRRPNYLYVTALIVVAGFLVIIGETRYKVLGILPLLAVAVYMIRSSQSKRKKINMARPMEDSFLLLDHRLVQLNKKVSDLKNEESLIQTRRASTELKFKQVWSDLENLQGKIENITEEINKYNVLLLYQEKESLIQKMRTAGVT